MIRPRRSLLFMPGSNARALEKARNLPADGIILDLEDSVAPDAKAVARDQIAKAIAAGGFGKREVLIRVNSLDTPWWVDDVTMAGKARPDGILVPKISTVADLNAIANRLSDINADMSIRVWAMIETARAVLDADKLAAASRDSETRLAGFVFGPNDISRETRIRMQPGRAAMIPMITHCILATRAHGLEILDGPYSDISNIDGFAVECAQGRDLGFDGKTLIHPSHIEACNAIFTPPAEEVAEARKIIAAFEKPENASRGAIQLDGRMVERLHADMARRTIAIADAIAAMGKNLIALQAQDVIREIVGLIGRDDEIGHPVMAGLEEYFQRQRRGRCPVGDRDEIRRAAPGAHGHGLDRVTILAPGLGETMPGRGAV